MITVSDYGIGYGGVTSKLYTVVVGKYSFSVTDYGAALVSLTVPDRNGKPTDVILGTKSADTRVGQAVRFFGVTVGRVANRIKGGKFTLGGKEYTLFKNENGNTLHGGKVGFDRRIFSVTEQTEDSITFFYNSPDGDDGFPGNLGISVQYRITEGGELSITYNAVSDKDTPFNPTNHTFFNLAGCDSGMSVAGHMISIDADRMLKADKALSPTGEILNVSGTPSDLRKPTRIADRISAKCVEMCRAKGFDHCYILNDRKDGSPAATAYSPLTGIKMICTTDRPAIQFYVLKCATIPNHKGEVKRNYSAFCLETQGYNDAVNNQSFPSVILKKGENFVSKTTYRFTVE